MTRPGLGAGPSEKSKIQNKNPKTQKIQINLHFFNQIFRRFFVTYILHRSVNLKGKLVNLMVEAYLILFLGLFQCNLDFTQIISRLRFLLGNDCFKHLCHIYNVVKENSGKNVHHSTTPKQSKMCTAPASAPHRQKTSKD